MLSGQWEGLIEVLRQLNGGEEAHVAGVSVRGAHRHLGGALGAGVGGHGWNGQC